MVAALVPALAMVASPVVLVMAMGLTAPELAAVVMALVHRAAVVLVLELAPVVVALAPVLVLAAAEPVPALALVRAPASTRPTLVAQVPALVAAVSCLRL